MEFKYQHVYCATYEEFLTFEEFIYVEDFFLYYCDRLHHRFEHRIDHFQLNRWGVVHVQRNFIYRQIRLKRLMPSLITEVESELCTISAIVSIVRGICSVWLEFLFSLRRSYFIREVYIYLNYQHYQCLNPFLQIKKNVYFHVKSTIHHNNSIFVTRKQLFVQIEIQFMINSRTIVKWQNCF